MGREHSSEFMLFENYSAAKEKMLRYNLSEGLIKTYSVSQCEKYILSHFNDVVKVIDFQSWIKRDIDSYWVTDIFSEENIYNDYRPKFCVLLKPTTSVKDINNCIYNLCGWIPYCISVRYTNERGVSMHYDCPYNDGLLPDDDINIIQNYGEVATDYKIVREIIKNKEVSGILICYIAKFSTEISLHRNALFHVTNVNKFLSIQKDGLCPKNRSNKLTDRVYLTEDPKYISNNVTDNNSILLKINALSLTETFFMDEKHNGCYYYLGNIRPSLISVLTKNDEFIAIDNCNIHDVKFLNK